MESEKACRYAEDKGKWEERARQNENAADGLKDISNQLGDIKTLANGAFGQMENRLARVQTDVTGLRQDHQEQNECLRDQNKCLSGLSADHRDQETRLRRIDSTLQEKGRQTNNILDALAKSSTLVSIFQVMISGNKNRSTDETLSLATDLREELLRDIQAAMSDVPPFLELGTTTAHHVKDFIPRLVQKRILEMEKIKNDPNEPAYKKMDANRFLQVSQSAKHDIDFRSIIALVVRRLPDVVASLEAFLRGESVGPLGRNQDLNGMCLILFNEDGTSALHIEHDGREDSPTNYNNDLADDLYSSLLCGSLGHRSATQFQITLRGGAAVSIYVSSKYKGGPLAGEMLGACFRVATNVPGVTGVLVDQGNPDDTQELNVQPQEIDEYLRRASTEEGLKLTVSKTTFIVGGGLNSSDATSQAVLFSSAPINFDRCFFTKDGIGAFQTAPGQQQGLRRHTYSNTLPVSTARIAEAMELGAFASLAILGVDVSELESPGLDALCTAAQAREWTITTRQDKIDDNDHLVFSSVTGFDAGRYLTNPNEDVVEEASVAPSEDDGVDSTSSAGQGNVPEFLGWGGCFKDVVIPIKDWQCEKCYGWNENACSHCIVCSVIRPIPEETTAEAASDSPATNHTATAPTSSPPSSATGSSLGSNNDGVVSAASGSTIGAMGFVYSAPSTNVGFGVHNGSSTEYFARHQSFGFTGTQSNANASSGPGTAISSNDGPTSDTELTIAENILKMEGAEESDVCQAIGIFSRHKDPRVEWATDRLLDAKSLEKIDNEGKGDCLFAAFVDAREAASSDGAQRHFQILTARLNAVEWIDRTYKTGGIPGIREAIEAYVSIWVSAEYVDSETGEKKSRQKPADSELDDVQYYCSKLKVEGEKGGEAEILGLAHHYGITIVVVDYACSEYIVIYPGDETTSMSRDHRKLKDGFDIPDGSIILAHVWGGQHYVAIREKDKVRPCSVLCALLFCCICA